MNQIESAGQQKTGGEAGLQAQPLLMQKAGQTRWHVQMQTSAGNHERNRKSAEKGEEDARRSAIEERAVPEPNGTGHRPGMKLGERRDYSSPQNGYSI